VTIENQAVSNQHGETDLYLSSYNKGDHRLGFTANREKQTITSIELDQYLLNSLEPIHFIKSETQGHERQVIEGLTKLIKRNSDHLCCLLEFSPGLLAAAESQGVERFLDFFDLFNTEIYWIHEKGQNPELVLMYKTALTELGRTMLKYDDQDRSCNILVFFSIKARTKYFVKMGW
jgi:hypothetical protein